METQVYKVLQELEEVLTKDKRLVVSAQDLSYVIGQLRAILTIYKDDEPPQPQHMDAIEARRPPRHPPAKKKRWFQYLIG